MKVPLLPAIALCTLASPAFAACVAPLNDVQIPNGYKASMDDMIAANHAIQENTTEVEAFFHCLKAEQAARLDAIGPDITDETKSRIAAEYASRQAAETEKLQKLADRFDAAERTFRARQAAAQSTAEDKQEAAAVNSAEQDAAIKARHEAAAVKAEVQAATPALPKGN